MMSWLEKYIEIVKALGALVVAGIGIFYIPSALEDARLKQSIYSSIVQSVDTLTTRTDISKRDIAVSGMDYMLKSRVLNNAEGKRLFENICCSILHDYQYAGDARRIMKMLQDNSIDIASHAFALSKYAAVVDDVDVLGGIDINKESACSKRMKSRRGNIFEISQHIGAAMIHYDNIVYILKNRSTVHRFWKEQRYIMDLKNRMSWLLRWKNAVVHVDDTPKWITTCQVRFYHDDDRSFACKLVGVVDQFMKKNTYYDGGCQLVDCALSMQGKMLPKGVVEITLPWPYRASPCEGPEESD